MQYFTQLGFGRDPFSLSPDPAFFHPSEQHTGCLRRLETAIRRHRGLTAVIGKAGTGKTMLLRRFLSRLASVIRFDVHFMPDPDFPSARAFMELLCVRVSGRRPDSLLTDEEIMERIGKALLLNHADQRQTVLIVDDAQRLRPECLDVLRRLLDNGPESDGPLQIVLFGRPELEAAVKDADGGRLWLEPLSRGGTAALVGHRLERAMPSGQPRPSLFTRCALLAIHKATGGYPGRVVRLCRMALASMASQGGQRVTVRLVRRCVREDGGRVLDRRRFCRPALGPALAVAMVVLLAAGAGALVRYVPMVSNVLTGLERATAAVESTTGQILDVPVLEPAVRGDPPEHRPPYGFPVGNRADTVEPLPLADLPGSLGIIRIMPGETVSELVRRVYGAESPGLLRLVAQANPGLGDLSRVPAGSPVRFPAREALVASLPANAYWVGLSSSNQLERAYAQLRQYGYFGLDCRILSSWSDEDGLLFLVTLAAPYPDRAAALAALAGLPLALQPMAEPWNAALMGYVVLGALGPDGLPADLSGN